MVIQESSLFCELTEEELAAELKKIIEAVGAKGPQDMGKVMAALMPKVKGRADGKKVNEAVRKFLN